ncbi:MAG: hypothetical protein AAF729_13785 [Pseudomonadota bacterium]
MLRKPGLIALVFSGLALPLHAQSVDATVAQMKVALDWSGQARTNRDGLYSVRLEPDGCNFRLSVLGARDGSKFAGKLGVRFRDLDPGSLKFRRHRDGISMRIETKNERETVNVVGKVEGGSQLRVVRKDVRRRPETGKCDARSCTITELKDAIPSTYIGPKSTTTQRTIAQAFQTLERLCRRGG